MNKNKKKLFQRYVTLAIYLELITQQLFLNRNTYCIRTKHQPVCFLNAEMQQNKHGNSVASPATGHRGYKHVPLDCARL